MSIQYKFYFMKIKKTKKYIAQKIKNASIYEKRNKKR